MVCCTSWQTSLSEASGIRQSFMSTMEKMKRVLLIAICILLLGACVRPATRYAGETVEPATLPSVTASPSAAGRTSTPANTQSIPDQPTATLPAQFPASMKGYELYSWKEGETWNYTLITATNRLKSFDEIIDPQNVIAPDGWVKMTAHGVDELKVLLGKLPAGTGVFWAGMDLAGQVPEGTPYLTFPSAEEQESLRRFCEGIGVALNLSQGD